MEIEFLELSYKIEKLNKSDKASWGIMTPQHMVEHLILAVRSGNGNLEVECFNPVEKLPILKRFLMSSRDLPKGFQNPLLKEGLEDLIFTSLAEAKTNLKTEIELHFSFYQKNPKNSVVNATFGELNFAEWNQFHKKHFEHHLKQFKLID